jgi:hypothetical protein
VKPLQLCNTFSEEKQTGYANLMHAIVQVNGRDIRAILDTRATNNFVAQREVDRMGLNLLDSTSKIKVVNSGAMPIRGVEITQN